MFDLEGPDVVFAVIQDVAEIGVAAGQSRPVIEAIMLLTISQQISVSPRFIVSSSVLYCVLGLIFPGCSDLGHGRHGFECPALARWRRESEQSPAVLA